MSGTPAPRPPEPERPGLARLVQSALAVPGVRGAKVGRQRHGDRVVRLELEPGADPSAVAEAVRGRVAPDADAGAEAPPDADAADAALVTAPARAGRIPVPALSAPAVASTPAPRWLAEPAPARSRRPPEPPGPASRGDRLELRRVQVAREGTGVVAEVVLARGAVLHTGVADAAATPSGTRRAVAGAVARCLESAAGGRVRIEVEGVQVEQVAGAPTAVVALSLVTDHGHEPLRGAALEDGDPARAVVHAALAAANRRLAPSLVDHQAVDG